MTKRTKTSLILLFVRRFFGNRSYCYDRMGQYEKALQDADVAISLAPDWPKGYFRRGRALAGLKVLTSAIFSGVLGNGRLLRFCFAALDCWLRKLAPLPQPIRFKFQTNDELVTRFPALYDKSSKLAPLPRPIKLNFKTNGDVATQSFPRFRPLACFYFY